MYNPVENDPIVLAILKSVAVMPGKFEEKRRALIRAGKLTEMYTEYGGLIPAMRSALILNGTPDVQALPERDDLRRGPSKVNLEALDSSCCPWWRVGDLWEGKIEPNHGPPQQDSQASRNPARRQQP
jgi:hypothetical protein